MRKQYKSKHDVQSIPIFGFTLIELLIVVAIIAILAGMLLPSLRKASERGKLAICQNNERQIATGINMYAGDFSESYPPYHAQVIVSGDREKWPGTLSANNYVHYKNYLCPSRDFKNSDCLEYYNRMKGRMNNILVNDTAWQFVDYGYNYRYIGRAVDTMEPPAKINEIKAPSKTILLAESIDATRQTGSYVIQPKYSATDTVAYPAHINTCASAWCDGSVRSLSTRGLGEEWIIHIYQKGEPLAGLYVDTQNNVWDRN